MLANQQPAITSLKAAADWIAPSGSLNVTCNATAPHGDELSYNWSASGGKITGEGATVTWTAPLSAGSYNVTVTVTDSRGGEVTDYVTITVRANSPPTINSLVADASWTAPAGSLQVTCNATDPDGDALTYEWTTTGGNISGTGAAVNWTAPQEVGTYNITVVVKDGHGREDTRFVSLSVTLNPPPVIENLTVTAQEPKYLKITSSGYTVGRTKQYDIACNVSDTSGGVSYNWSCESGVISGEGSMITWTAPDESLDRTTVTVIVSDAAGNMVSRSIVFKVASCTSCTFG
jgi:predicted secreted protein